jgi:hypothetical protein
MSQAPKTGSTRKAGPVAPVVAATASSAASRTSSAGPVQQDMRSSVRTPEPEPGFGDPYKMLADCRRVLVAKELTNAAKFINCVVGFCGVTRYRYYVKDAATGRDLFKAKLSYSSSWSSCSGATKHNYTLDIFTLPLDGSKVLKDQAKHGMFVSTSSSEKSALAAGGHGVMDMRNAETLGKVIPSPAGSFTIKDGSSATAFRVALPVSVGYGATSSEMLVEDGATTALVGRIVKQWGRSDNDWTFMCCCGSGGENGTFTLDMAAVSNVRKRALLVVAAILADGVSFQFRAAPPALLTNPSDDSPIRPKAETTTAEEKKSLVAGSS